MSAILADVFVERRGGSLWLGDQPFRFVLVNAYYLQEEAARGRLDVVDETLAAAGAMGAKAVRAWAFNDDPNKHDTGIQRGPSVYSQRGLDGIARMIERARAHGIRLILPLVNYWNAYGGARQWLLWHGVADAVEGDVRFFTDERVRAHYASHVARMVAPYRDEPTVLAWELMNEPRGVPADWVRFAARAVKAAAPNHLVGVGDEGEEWSSGLLDCEELDLASCHFYPHKYGHPRGSEAEAGVAWIEEHARLAAAAGKPLVVGEFGIANGAIPSEKRLEAYRAWLRAAVDSPGVAGIGPWLFAYRSRPPDWDEFTFYRDDPIAQELHNASEAFKDSLQRVPLTAGR
jgi:mannan endo-1,4-beta-mannosidase